MLNRSNSCWRLPMLLLWCKVLCNPARNNRQSIDSLKIRKPGCRVDPFIRQIYLQRLAVLRLFHRDFIVASNVHKLVVGESSG